MDMARQLPPITPLHWSMDWGRLNGWQKLLADFPFVGVQATNHRSLRQQLRVRQSDFIETWRAYSATQLAVSRKISGIIQRELVWPNDHFIPADPFGIMVWDADAVATTQALVEIETYFGWPPKPEAEWELMLKKSYGEFISLLPA